MTAQNILSVKNLSFKYGSFEILSDLTFAVEQGDYVALAGPNGAGKTTLIRIALGLIDNHSGVISLFGDSKEFKSWNRIGYLPQRTSSFNPLFPATVGEVVRLGLLSQKKFPRRFVKSDEQKVKYILKVLGIEHLRNKMIGKLSGGQQQRVFLARALVANPELLILDEPSTALDPQIRNDFFELIKKLNKEQGITIILVTHDTAHVGQYANKLLYLDKKVIFYGNFDDFCHSGDMQEYFGNFSQHLICHRHDN